MATGQDKESVARWVVRKEVSLGDLIAFGAAFVSMIYAFTTLDKRQTLSEEKLTQQVIVDKRQDEEQQRFQARIELALNSLNAKLDRLVEQSRPAASAPGRYVEGRVVNP